jgi:hypothetical protein
MIANAGAALATRPLATLGALGVLPLLAAIVQGGMSERLRLTTAHLVNDLDRAISTTMPLAGLFRAAVTWVPRHLPAWLPGGSGPSSAFLMAMWGYALSVAVLFALYALAAHWLARHATALTANRRTVAVIAGISAATSVILLFTPATPSHDPFAYAESGRLLLTYHANPFFTLPGAYPNDAVLRANEWPASVTAYGPLWSLLSLALAPIVGGDPLRANMVYRVVALAAQLGNLALLAAILRRLPARHAAWRAQGLLLYAWNPLILIEVAAGHNDVLMLTCLLLCFWLLLDARWRLAALALAAAVLIKASAVPLVGLIALALLLRANPRLRVPPLAELRRRWRTPEPLATRLRAIASACGLRQGSGIRVTRQWLAFAGVRLGTIVVGYLPFYWGHSLGEIAATSGLQPATQQLDRALTGSFGTLAQGIGGIAFLPRPLAASLAHAAALLAIPTFWSALLGVGLIALTLRLLPDLRRPLRLPIVLAAVYAAWMLFLCIFYLLRTWYLIPLVGLVCLTPFGRPVRRLALTLTASIQLVTFFLSKSPPFDGWQPWSVLLVAGIPLAVLFWELRRDPLAGQPATPFPLAPQGEGARG